MDPLVPWLLLAVAALVIACQALYLRMRRLESVRSALESLQEEEARTVEAVLSTLVADETGTPPPPASPAAPTGRAGDWRAQAVLLSRAGVPAPEIARRLNVPDGEVELVLSLAAARKP